MKKFIVLLFLGLLLPTIAWARIGVGVGTGKIQVDEQLKPGMSYHLPPLTVLNTGDEESDYETEVTYHQDQPEMKPEQSWFSFKPRKFHLEPSEVQLVEIQLDLPLKAKPGDYFAYLEGHPLKKSQAGQTAIGVAAAAKLYFTVVPANIFQAIYYKVTAFWINNSPWTNIIAGVVIFFLLKKFLKKRFKFQFNIQKKPNREENKKEVSDE